MEDGWIYVLMSASNIDRFKVGKTKNHPVARLKQLRTGDPTLALQVAYFVPSLLNITLSGLESHIHQSLTESHGRLNFFDETSSEWFAGDVRDAWSELDMIIEGCELTVTDWYQPGENKVVRYWGGDLEDEYRRRFEPPFEVNSDLWN